MLDTLEGWDWLPIGAPDTVASALRAIGRWSLDEAGERLDARDWWFRATFAAPQFSDQSIPVLAFAGLAGECRAWLNGQPLLASDNMHLAHECTAPLLVDENNELLMRFASLDAKLAQRRPRPRWRAPMIEHQQLRWARVSPLGRTPGWSPPAPAIGPWRPIEWIECREIEVAEPQLWSSLEAGVGRVALEIGLSPTSTAAAISKATLRVDRDGHLHDVEMVPSGRGRYTATAAIADPALWWPHTHGEPALYCVSLAVEMAGASRTITVDVGQVGFRTLSIDTVGGDFALHVNGIRIFCRGANWTPLDVVSPAALPEETHAALAQAAAAGLNIMRVNGCMVYEDSAFYESCDALGLLVWQDFMFANMDYPAHDPAFAASVGEEARQQLARWQSHASLAVICGNSEAEQQAAMWGSPRETWEQSLFHETLRSLANEYCPDVLYWPSSAHAGTFPHQVDTGTTSYYGVGAYLRPLEDARRCGLRFATECLAFANIPTVTTLSRLPGAVEQRTTSTFRDARTPRDLGATWDFGEVRDHYLNRLYRVDPVALRSVDPQRYLELSRAVSAEVIEATVSEWRRSASTCRGALVWFLRDLWAGSGWGMLDDLGAPKAAFHGLRRASQPIHLFLTDEGTNGLALHVINDPATPLEAIVELALFREDGLILRSASREVLIPPHDSRTWPAGEWFDEFLDLSRAYRFGPAEFMLVSATIRRRDGRSLDRAFYFPEGLPNTRSYDVGLQVAQSQTGSDGRIMLEISARRFAQSVHFEAPGLLPDEDHFHLVPGEMRMIGFSPRPGRTGSAANVSVLAINAWSGPTIELARC